MHAVIQSLIKMVVWGHKR